MTSSFYLILCSRHLWALKLQKGTDTGFTAFANRYYTENMLGVDFDFEAGQSQSVIDSLNQRVKVSQAQFPRLRFSFSLATLGGNSSQNLGSIGVTVMNSIKSAGLTHYTINLTE